MSSMSVKWTRLHGSDRLQRSSQTVSVVNNKIWIFGGELLPRQPIDNHFDVIDLSASPTYVHTTFAHGDAPSPRVGSASAVLDNRIFFFSGRGGTAMAPIEETGGLWCFDTIASKWEFIAPVDYMAPYPVARSYHTMTSDGSETLFVHAGCPEKGRLRDLWAFHVGSKRWKSLPVAPGPPRGGASITYMDGKLYRINGFDGLEEQGGSLDVFDLSVHLWSTITYPMDGISGPEARSVGALLPLKIDKKKFLITLFGEHDPSSLGHAGAGKMLGNAWAYDITARKWLALSANGNAPQSRGWFDGDVIQDWEGKQAIIVHGGLAEDNSRLGDVWTLQVV